MVLLLLLSSPTRLSSERRLCPNCGSARKWFCYKCMIPLIEPLSTTTITTTTSSTSSTTSSSLPSFNNASPTGVMPSSSSPSSSPPSSSSTLASDDDSAPKSPRSSPSSTTKTVLPGLNGLPVTPFRLPLNIGVLHHPREHLSKSTAVHAKILCSDQVHFIDYPALPVEWNPKDTLLLFPDEVLSNSICCHWSDLVHVDIDW
jgi:hypothetical protein